MKKARNKIIAVLLLAAALFLYYYAALPAINIHSIETWWFILIGMLIISVLLSLRSLAREQKTIKKWSELSGFIHWKHLGIGKLAFVASVGAYDWNNFVFPDYQCQKVPAADDCGGTELYRRYHTGRFQYDSDFGQRFSGAFRRSKDGQHGGYGFPI